MYPTDRTRVRLDQTESVGSSQCYGRPTQQVQSRGRRGWPVRVEMCDSVAGLN